MAKSTAVGSVSSVAPDDPPTDTRNTEAIVVAYNDLYCVFESLTSRILPRRFVTHPITLVFLSTLSSSFLAAIFAFVTGSAFIIFHTICATIMRGLLLFITLEIRLAIILAIAPVLLATLSIILSASIIATAIVAQEAFLFATRKWCTSKTFSFLSETGSRVAQSIQDNPWIRSSRGLLASFMDKVSWVLISIFTLALATPRLIFSALMNAWSYMTNREAPHEDPYSTPAGPGIEIKENITSPMFASIVSFILVSPKLVSSILKNALTNCRLPSPNSPALIKDLSLVPASGSPKKGDITPSRNRAATLKGGSLPPVPESTKKEATSSSTNRAATSKEKITSTSAVGVTGKETTNPSISRATSYKNLPTADNNGYRSDTEAYGVPPPAVLRSRRVGQASRRTVDLYHVPL